MISEFLGTKQVLISFQKEGKGWRVKVPKIIDGAIEPIEGADGEGVTKIANTAYWMGSYYSATSPVAIRRASQLPFHPRPRNPVRIPSSASYF